MQLDSDEEPLSLLERRKAELEEAASAAGAEAEREGTGEGGGGGRAGEKEAGGSVLERFAEDQAGLTPSYEETKLPKWLYKYLVYRFNLLDRTGESTFGSEPLCPTWCFIAGFVWHESRPGPVRPGLSRGS